MKVCLYGRSGKVGRVLAPALEAAGHELVAVEAADAAVAQINPALALAA